MRPLIGVRAACNSPTRPRSLWCTVALLPLSVPDKAARLHVWWPVPDEGPTLSAFSVVSPSPQEHDMPGHDIIVVGTSAGGVEALQRLVGGLPYDLPATLFIVLHLLPERPSFLAQILSRAGPLPATQAMNGAAMTEGHLYVDRPH